MTDHITAMKQALEALEFSTELNTHHRLMTGAELKHACAAITSLRAALAQQQQARDDGMPDNADERHLRRLLAARVAMPGLYTDDGEAYGAQHGVSIDFMREPVAHIDAKLRALNVARLEMAQQQGEPVAYLKQFGAGGRRVDLHPECEPWLAVMEPTITPLYTAPPAPAAAPAWVWNPASLKWERVHVPELRQPGAIYAYADEMPAPLVPAAAPPGWVLVPVEPTEEQWSGFARDLMLAFDAGCKSPRLLMQFLRRSGTDAPDWLLREIGDPGSDAVMAKGTRVVLIYRAMLAARPAAPTEGDKQ